MKVSHYPIRKFDDQKTKEIDIVVVPKRSQFLGIVILHDGIYAYYAIPELVTAEEQTEKFVLMTPNQSIPENSDFIGLYDTIIDTPKGQGIVVFPVFKLK